MSVIGYGGIIGLVFGLIGSYLSYFIVSIPEFSNGNVSLVLRYEVIGYMLVYVLPSIIILTPVGIIIGAITGKIFSSGEQITN